MNRFFAIVSFVLLTVSLGNAQATEPAKSAAPADSHSKTAKAPKALTVKEILERNRKAVGSTLTKKKITTLVSTGTFSIAAMGATGTVEVYAKAPNKQVTFTVLKGFGAISEGFDGVEGWSQDPVTGLRTKSGTELARAKLDSIFDRDAVLNTLYPKMETKGIEQVNGHDAYVIVATTVDAGSETWYFDAETFMLVRQDAVVDGPTGKLPIQNFFADFRSVGGVMTPFQITATNPSYTAVINLTEIKTNVAIDDAKFKKPAAQ